MEQRDPILLQVNNLQQLPSMFHAGTDDSGEPIHEQNLEGPRGHLRRFDACLRAAIRAHTEHPIVITYGPLVTPGDTPDADTMVIRLITPGPTESDLSRQGMDPVTVMGGLLGDLAKVREAVANALAAFCRAERGIVTQRVLVSSTMPRIGSTTMVSTEGDAEDVELLDSGSETDRVSSMASHRSS